MFPRALRRSLLFAALATGQPISKEAATADADCRADNLTGTAADRAADQSTDDRASDRTGNTAEFRITGLNGWVR